MEDFTYTGNPPRSRESAVVMLADVTEAAVRTLNKPTAAKMEKFIQELIKTKVEHGQLIESELTFRDLETIKNAFVRVLAGYYHSRIEYPKLKEIPE
jgi:membrane-associated HD superfamily phosphohydrolase